MQFTMQSMGQSQAYAHPKYRELFGISIVLNCHIFELIFNQLTVHRYIPSLYRVPSLASVNVLFTDFLTCPHISRVKLFETQR